MSVVGCSCAEVDRGRAVSTFSPMHCSRWGPGEHRELELLLSAALTCWGVARVLAEH